MQKKSFTIPNKLVYIVASSTAVKNLGQSSTRSLDRFFDDDNDNRKTLDLLASIMDDDSVQK
jgi:hypothetical protein